MRFHCLLAAVLTAACGSVSATKTDAAVVVGDDAAIDAPPECPIGTTELCAGNGLVSCDGQGNVTGTETCALGCNATESRCNLVAPSNNLAVLFDEAAASTDLVLSGVTVIDTDAGSVVDSTGARTPLTSTVDGSPVDMLVIKVKSFTTGGTISVEGTRALVILSGGDVVLNHDISASARLEVNGPGAVTTATSCRGGQAGGANANGHAGGGGGGFGTVGGAGGTGGLPEVNGGLGGTVAGNAELVPLRGGCPGGRSGQGTVTGHTPGAGGGAVQIVSGTRITLAAGTEIRVNGSGARGPLGPFACLAGTPCGVGEGGGAGGGVLLEAPVVTMDPAASIVANGGGGKCGVDGSAQSGQRSTDVALGQVCGGDTGNGGNGAAGSTEAQNGGDGLNDDPVGGGGGGGMGRIRINLPQGVTFTPGTISGVMTTGVLQTR